MHDLTSINILFSPLSLYRNKWSRKKKSSSPKQEVQEDDIFVVEKLVGKKKARGVTYYKVRWKNYEPKDDTWEAESNIFAKELIDKYEKENSKKKGKK